MVPPRPICQRRSSIPPPRQGFFFRRFLLTRLSPGARLERAATRDGPTPQGRRSTAGVGVPLPVMMFFSGRLRTEVPPNNAAVPRWAWKIKRHFSNDPQLCAKRLFSSNQMGVAVGPPRPAKARFGPPEPSGHRNLPAFNRGSAWPTTTFGPIDLWKRVVFPGGTVVSPPPPAATGGPPGATAPAPRMEAPRVGLSPPEETVFRLGVARVGRPATPPLVLGGVHKPGLSEPYFRFRPLNAPRPPQSGRLVGDVFRPRAKRRACSHQPTGPPGHALPTPPRAEKLALPPPAPRRPLKHAPSQEKWVCPPDFWVVCPRAPPARDRRRPFLAGGEGPPFPSTRPGRNQGPYRPTRRFY